MEKFAKQAQPTFREVAQIGADGLIDLEFKAKGRKAFNALMKSIGTGEGQISEAQALNELIGGWDHEHPESLVRVPYSLEVLEDLLDEFWSAGSDIIGAYIKGRSTAKKPT